MTKLVSIDPALLGLVHGQFGAGGALQPFVRDIPLLETYVAGTSYRCLDAVLPTLALGSRLVLEREPDNPHDARAIRIRSEAHVDLGYVPRAKNEVLASLLDAGKLLFGRLDQKLQHDQRKYCTAKHELRVTIFLRDQ
jgi:hypothetical protein